MIKAFRVQVEHHLGHEISINELNCAVEATKDDVFCNNIIFGKDVPFDYFLKKVCEYIKCIRRPLQ